MAEIRKAILEIISYHIKNGMIDHGDITSFASIYANELISKGYLSKTGEILKEES